MHVLYEVPGQFRITYIPSVADYPGGKPRLRSEPIVLDCRHPQVSKVEHAELPLALFQALRAMSDACRGAVAPYLQAPYQLSQAMLHHVKSIPADALASLAS